MHQNLNNFCSNFLCSVCRAYVVGQKSRRDRKLLFPYSLQLKISDGGSHNRSEFEFSQKIPKIVDFSVKFCILDEIFKQEEYFPAN